MKAIRHSIVVLLSLHLWFSAAYAQEADGEWLLPEWHTGFVGGRVAASAVDAAGNIYAGGSFTSAGGIRYGMQPPCDNCVKAGNPVRYLPVAISLSITKPVNDLRMCRYPDRRA